MQICKGTGLQYAESVQDLLGKRFVEAFDATDSVFHCMGREDIDVRCMGNGRPFVLELKAPAHRKLSESFEVAPLIFTRTRRKASFDRREVQPLRKIPLQGHTTSDRLEPRRTRVVLCCTIQHSRDDVAQGIIASPLNLQGWT